MTRPMHEAPTILTVADAPAILDALRAELPAVAWSHRSALSSDIIGSIGGGAAACRLSMRFGHWGLVVDGRELPLDRRDRADLQTFALAVRAALEAHHNQRLSLAAALRAALDTPKDMTPCG